MSVETSPQPSQFALGPMEQPHWATHRESEAPAAQQAASVETVDATNPRGISLDAIRRMAEAQGVATVPYQPRGSLGETQAAFDRIDPSVPSAEELRVARLWQHAGRLNGADLPDESAGLLRPADGSGPVSEYGAAFDRASRPMHTESDKRLTALARQIDKDPVSRARFKAARQVEIAVARQRRAERREQRIERLTTAGAVAVGGLRRAARWMHTRHVATKHAVGNAARATAAYMS